MHEGDIMDSETFQNLHSNIIDKWLVQLTGELNGFGMIFFVIITLALAAALSSLIGFERYRKGKNAGMKTHSLLAIGCSFIMTISIWAIPYRSEFDISRIAAGAVTGIGFLGAGVIIKDKFTVKGLSTATTLWVCAAIGLATGAGFVVEAIAATIVTLLAVFVRDLIIYNYDKNSPHLIVKAKVGYPALNRIKTICEENSVNLKHTDVIQIDDKTVTVQAHFQYHINPNLLEYLIKELKKEPDVIEASKVVKKVVKHVDNTTE